MCGFVGFIDYKKDLSDKKSILTSMNNTLSKRGPDEEGYYINKHVALAHKRLIVIDADGGKQPMIEKYSYGEYVMVYNGQIYNTKRINTLVCPNCGGKLEQRFDDTIESINKRFEGFYKDTYPLIDKYKKDNVLFEVDASGTPDQVAETCLRIINEHNN